MSGQLGKRGTGADDAPVLTRLALLTLLGGVCACNAPTETKAPAPPPPPEAPAVVLTPQQLHERNEKCANDARERFRADGGQGSAEFAQHYNTKLDTCFYLLTVSLPESPAMLSRKLVDIYENELYGEYRGSSTDTSPPDRTPDTCRVMSMYCASGREWEVLVRFFMEG